MGSGFSIINNTNEDIWVYIGPNNKVLFPLLGGVTALMTADVAAVAFASVGGALAATSLSDNEQSAAFINTDSVLEQHGMKLPVGIPPLTVASAYQWATLDMIDHATKDACMHLSQMIEKYKYKMLKPGEKYDFHGTLSLTMTCHMITNRTFKEFKKTVWTAATNKNVNEYFLSSIINESIEEARIVNYDGPFYWQRYGNNSYIKIKCSSSTVRKYEKSYPSKQLQQSLDGYYWRENENASNVWVVHKVVKPNLTYCADTYWYSYHDDGKWPDIECSLEI